MTGSAHSGSPLAPRVMISYRREDTADVAASLYRALVERFGTDNVFLDVDRISPGADWAQAIEDAVGRSDVVLALLGERWATVVGEAGKLRIHEEDDVVRHEVASALARADIRVIPVCVGSARLPPAADLPPDLADLRARQALSIEREGDFGRLLQAIESLAERPWPGGLPRPQSSFVGRAAETAAVATLIATDGVRLVTLTGPGGAGKTRLAIESVAKLSRHFRDGIRLVDLSALEDPSLVLSSVAAGLGVEGDPPVDLAERELLVVLDNFEHVIDAAPDVGRLLAACLRLKIVCTSRAPLRIDGEHVFEVQPLDPDDAVGLFVRRAAERGIAIGDEEAVRALCVRLDGLPLAVELAAARAQLYSVAELAKRLEQELPVFGEGRRDAPARQRTLAATVDWSYGLLTREQQRVFRRLAVFHGGFTFAGAEAVAEADEASLAVLVESSLARRRETPGGSRFEFLAVIREFARARLTESEEEGELRRRHCAFYVDFAERARVGFNDSQDLWADAIAKESANLRASLEWSAVHDPASSLVQLVGRLGRFWGRVGLHREIEAWAGTALAASPDSPTVDRARCLHAAGVAAYSLGDLESAGAAFERSAAMWRSLGDETELAKQLTNIGTVHVELGQLDDAAALYEQAAASARRAGDAREEVAALGHLGVVLEHQGAPERALAVFEDVVVKAEGMGDDDGLAWGLSNLGLVAMKVGRYEQAEAALLRALQLLRRFGWGEGLIYTLFGLSRAVLEQGDAARALRVLNGADRLSDSVGLTLQRREAADREETLSKIRTRCGDSFAAAWKSASEITVDAIVAAECKSVGGASLRPG